MNELVENTEKLGVDGQDDPYMINSLARGLVLLRCFTAERPTLSLSELATMLGWQRTAPFRFVYTLQKLGYLQQEPGSKRYRLTPKVLELGFDYLHSLQLPEIVRPYLEQLRDNTGASAHLGLLDRLEVVYVLRIQTRLAIASNVNVGSRFPAHATAMGKVLLAFQPSLVLESLLNNGLTAFTTNTITDPLRFKAELQQIQLQGIAFSNEEYELGIRSIAAPVRDFSGNAVAAINISAPAAVLPQTGADSEVAQMVRQAGLDISAWLGWKD
jgi:IclR family pca regulon transcriptional regulator